MVLRGFPDLWLAYQRMHCTDQIASQEFETKYTGGGEKFRGKAETQWVAAHAQGDWVRKDHIQRIRGNKRDRGGEQASPWSFPGAGPCRSLIVWQSLGSWENSASLQKKKDLWTWTCWADLSSFQLKHPLLRRWPMGYLNQAHLGNC